MKNVATEELRHKEFISKVCESGAVFGLENDEGFAMSTSAEFENADGKPAELICFWSEKNLAEKCEIKEWLGYRATEIALSDFMENWCIGMYEDGLLVGTDFDNELSGYEIEPLDLVLELCAELKKHGKQISFENFKNIDELEKEINAIKSEE